jgi:hypothetical protein
MYDYENTGLNVWGEKPRAESPGVWESRPQMPIGPGGCLLFKGIQIFPLDLSHLPIPCLSFVFAPGLPCRLQAIANAHKSMLDVNLLLLANQLAPLLHSTTLQPMTRSEMSIYWVGYAQKNSVKSALMPTLALLLH